MGKVRFVKDLDLLGSHSSQVTGTRIQTWNFILQGMGNHGRFLSRGMT